MVETEHARRFSRVAHIPRDRGIRPFCGAFETKLPDEATLTSKLNSGVRIFRARDKQFARIAHRHSGGNDNPTVEKSGRLPVFLTVV